MSDQEKSQDLFSSFMKKQIDSKKKEAEIKTVAKKKAEKTKDKKDSDADSANKENEDVTEEMTEEEELEEAKKESRNKAAQVDQTEMFKKLIMENFVKYAVLTTVLVIVAFAVIKFGSAFLAMINGIVFKALMGALNAK
jgi:hypothetical protein